MEDKIQEIDKKLEQTEDDEITISLLYQKIELLEDLINEYEVNMNCGRQNQDTLSETIKILQKDLKKKNETINNAITEIETLRTYFSEDLQPDFIRILEILKDKKVIDW